MVAAALTDSQYLVRIVVAKPQNSQMLQMLISKLGGLLNRRVFHMPFNRALKLSAADAEKVYDLCQRCVRVQGVLLIQPEAILSLKLMGIEACHAGSDASRPLLKIQQLFDEGSRTLIDESDENFDVKLEVVYTMGCQASVELAPYRWLVIQQILSLVGRYAPDIKLQLPQSIEIQSGAYGMFPRIRILRKDAADKLVELLAKHVVEHGLNGLPTRHEPPTLQRAIVVYIAQQDLSSNEIQAVEGSNCWTESIKNVVWLIRGIFAGGLLRFALYSKRYRVNYGLDSSRSPPTELAVPYKFKDGPSQRSEFSHPDVIIILTSLAHYYSGISDENLFDLFNLLLKSDQATMEYDEWVATASPDLPLAFRSLSGVNLKDRTLCRESLFPFLRYSKSCVDYFLSRLVFPKQLRQFTYKISASGWDISAARTCTGFSGTSDSRFLLPLAVRHLDLPDQCHTNALVLGNLIKDCSTVELLPARASGKTDASHLLSTIAALVPEIRVVIDSGAQILEQNNFQVAQTWLQQTDHDRIQAAVFFNNEELSILDRTGRVEAFQTSPWARQMNLCVVYLDEAHTRGIDLKLPRHYRAALTLGAGLTKDKLVQGAMRMRQLGKVSANSKGGR